MFVANEFTHDTRVFKEAQCLARAGFEVFVLALWRRGLPAQESMGGFRVERLKPGLRPALAGIGCLFLRGVAARSPGIPTSIPERSRPTSREAVDGSLTKEPPQTPRQGGRAPVARILRLLLRTPLHAPMSWALDLVFARRGVELAADVYHAHDLNTLPAGVMAKRAVGACLVYDAHELYAERNRDMWLAWLDRFMWTAVERRCIARCDLVCSVAESICVHLETRYGIPRPFLLRNLQPYEPPPDRTSLLADDLGIGRDRPLVIYPGAITFNRGLEQMIDSAPHLDAAAYVIMGYAHDPDYLAGLKRRAQALGVLDSRVYFRDAVPIKDVTRYVASADLGIVPTQNVCLSYYYEASNKIFTCITAGVPLIMSDHAEKRLLVERYGVGRLFDETDPRSIAECVNRTLEDRDGYATMRANCLSAARELCWEREKERLLAAYLRMLGAAAPAPSAAADKEA